MKIYIILFIAASIFTVHQQAYGAVECYTDSAGYTQCSGSDGYRSEAYTDDSGYTDWSDNQGGGGNCYTDSAGYTSCD
jgi:hypothetical protein